MYLLRKLASLILILGAITYAGFFAFLNSAPAYVVLPFYGEVKTSGAISYLLAFLAGALFASAYFVLDWTRKYMELRRHRRLALDMGYQANGKAKKRQISYDEDSGAELQNRLDLEDKNSRSNQSLPVEP